MILLTTIGVPRTLLVACTIAAATAVSSCDRAEPELTGPVDVDTYVMVMSELADLQRFPPPGRDQQMRDARADSARQEILDRHGVTVDELLAYAEKAGARPQLMLEISDRIVAVTDSLARLRTGAGRASDTSAVDDTTAGGADTATSIDDDTPTSSDDDTTVDTTAPPAGRREPGPLPSERQRLRELRQLRDSIRSESP